MADTAERPTPFDERAALEELERLRQGIEHYRLQRKSVGDQFEAFVGSFQKSPDMQMVPVKPATPTLAAAPATPVVDSAAPAPVPIVATAPVPPAQPAPATPRPPASSEPVMDALTARLRGIPSDAWVSPSEHSTAPAEVTEPQAQSSTPSRRSWVIVLAAVVVGLVAVLGWSFWPRGAAPARSTEAPTPTASAAIRRSAPSTPPPPTPAAAAPAEVPAAEVITTRAVWLRVIVDGERVLERQLPADTRVPLKAEKTIVIRTGDAGALRVSIAGKDQGPLGRDGQVVNLSFTMPPKAER